MHLIGGKPYLLEFLQDVAKNLNTKNSTTFAKTMKIFGGRRMADLFSLNFCGPNCDTISRANKKRLHFILGERREIFQCIIDIYSKAMMAHSISRSILVILLEDETKVKSRAT